jgi:hypothetical protein
MINSFQNRAIDKMNAGTPKEYRIPKIKRWNNKPTNNIFKYFVAFIYHS